MHVRMIDALEVEVFRQSSYESRNPASADRTVPFHTFAYGKQFTVLICFDACLHRGGFLLLLDNDYTTGQVVVFHGRNTADDFHAFDVIGGNVTHVYTGIHGVICVKRRIGVSEQLYQDVCYPVTKDFREKLYNEIISEYEKAKDKSNEKARESAEKHHGNPDKEKDKEATPFR